jgi:hypothetical protein
MKEADKAYTTYEVPDEDHPDPYEFLGQQIKGVIAFAAIVLGVWMLVGAVVLK